MKLKHALLLGGALVFLLVGYAAAQVQSVVIHPGESAQVVCEDWPTPTETLAPTETITPTATATITPTATATLTPTLTYTPEPTPEDVDIGTHGWQYALDTMVNNPQDNALISVVVPSMMYAEGYTYADLVNAAGWAGPTHSHYQSVVQYAQNSAGANILGYVPEDKSTAPSMPISETIDLELYAQLFADLGAQYPDKVLNYGPGLSMLCDPETYQPHQVCDLLTDRVASLSSLLPDGSFWSLRVITYERMYETDLPGFRAAIQQFVDAIHAGNPSIRIILHLSLEPEGATRFMAFADAAAGLYDQLYAGIDFPSSWDPNYDPEGTLLALEYVLCLSGACGASPTPTPQGPLVFYDLPYGDGLRNVLDLYIPAGYGPFPAVVWFHGGGMTSGDKAMIADQAAVLNAVGIAVAAANYCLVPDCYLPAQIEEAKAAVCWLNTNAGLYNLDPDRIGAAGGSAGAIIAATLATSGDGCSKINAAVILAGVYDFTRYLGGAWDYCLAQSPGEEIPACFMDGDSQGKGDFFHCYLNMPECQARVLASSAIMHVSPDDMPVSLWVGASDDTPYAQEDHQAFYEALLAVGVDSSLHVETTPGCVEHGEMWPCIEALVIDWLVGHL